MSSILSLTNDAIRRVEKNSDCIKIRKRPQFPSDNEIEIVLLVIIILFLLKSGADTTLLAAILYVIL